MLYRALYQVLFLFPVLSQSSGGSTPLFVTFDSHISPSSIAKVPFLSQEVFVWGATTSHVPAWRDASPDIKLSYYMPYSRAPAARLGFDLSFWQADHPDWILYRCDRKTVAFWHGESGNTGSVPLDFTNPDVIACQESKCLRSSSGLRCHGLRQLWWRCSPRRKCRPGLWHY